MKTLIINFPVLNIGGIEEYIVALIKYCSQQQYRVIWLARKPMQMNPAYSWILEWVDVVYTKRGITGNWKHDPLLLENVDTWIVSFTPFDMDGAIKLMEEYKSVPITPIYLVANTTGRYYFIEDYYFGVPHNYCYKKMKDISSEWLSDGLISFFSIKQIDAYEKYYKIEIFNKEKLVLPEVFEADEVDYVKLQERSERKNFDIITVGRFDFPHKNYILGLIRDFPKIKEIDNKIKLHIVGYGPGENLLKQEILKIPTQYQNDIVLYGALNGSDLQALMSKMSLNISTAGSASLGASLGLLTLVARNFCSSDECQVYGFYNEKKHMATSLEKGESCINYVANVIGMDDDEYKRLSIEGFKRYSDYAVNPEYIFEKNIPNSILIKSNHLFFRFFYVFRDIFYKIGQIVKHERRK